VKCIEWNTVWGYVTSHINNRWSLLSAAISARNLGETQLSLELFQQSVDYNNSLPPSQSVRDVHLAISYAGLGETEKSLNHMNAIYDAGMGWPWWFDAFDMTTDRYGVFDNIKDNIAFIDVQRRLQERNRTILASLRRDVPELFSPES